jgi:hypothetical protein
MASLVKHTNGDQSLRITIIKRELEMINLGDHTKNN